MRRSELFSKTSKAAPSGEVSKNAQLLLRAGYIHKEMAGVYAYLPLGLRVVEKIKQVVREEMNAIGAHELIMTNLQPKEQWDLTTRWDDKVVDIWFKTKLKDDTELGLAWSHEEPIINLMRTHINSYKDLPVIVYQFQTKLRNELRAKSGIMRGREFVMKDMYSMHTDAEGLDTFYNKTIEAYKRVYDRLGIGEETYVTFASGGAFTKFSHEFQTVCEAGEDVIYVHKGKNIAVNEEVVNDAIAELGIKREDLIKVKSAEVGNIFNFGTEKCDQMGLYYTDQAGNKSSIYLGSYGIGITRVMGVIVEKFSDERGIVWPESIAPFKVYLAGLGEEDEVVSAADKLYNELKAVGIEVLYDDRDARAGDKFGDADLLGLPYRLVVSSRSLQAGGYELKNRRTGDEQLVSTEKVIETLAK